MTKKDLKPERVISELRDQSVFFTGSKSPTKEKEKETKRKGVTDTLTHSVSDTVRQSHTDTLTHSSEDRLDDLSNYEVGDYRQLARGNLRLTPEQNRFLKDMEDAISGQRPEGERADPEYKRITKNSIIRALVEFARRLKLTVDASTFKNEQDLLRAIVEEIRKKLASDILSQ